MTGAAGRARIGAAGRIGVIGIVLLAGAASRAEPAAPEPGEPGTASAVFAGGCFWCMEPPFDALDGVLSTTSGYTGGSLANPTYEQVSAGGTGHVEAVQVRYDPQRVGYAKLLEVYWRNVDALDDGGQFCDRGESYRSAIFVGDAEQRRLAEASKRAIAARLGGPVATTIRDAAPFYPAEEYHQDYARKNPLRYRFYRSRCGRDARLERLWGGAPVH
ncbi:MAG: peptide-methionine (S)-S-oxide reductase MsrA [Deltaproteobacteria bacterium]|nr:peptide-methionine (S)-S-oxide reductase MsrA [Deltaproteobacteria bacterium]